MNEPRTWGEKIADGIVATAALLIGAAFAALLIAYPFVDVNVANAAILAARQSVFGW